MSLAIASLFEAGRPFGRWLERRQFSWRYDDDQVEPQVPQLPRLACPPNARWRARHGWLSAPYVGSLAETQVLRDVRRVPFEWLPLLPARCQQPRKLRGRRQWKQSPFRLAHAL